MIFRQPDSRTTQSVGCEASIPQTNSQGEPQLSKFKLEQMTWPEAKRAAEEHRVVLQPLAAIEQHGPHLPVDTDNLIVGELCEAAAKAHPGEFVVAPVIPYGFNDHNMEFPGTVSIRPTVLLEYLFDVGHSFATSGFDRVLWVNGHGSNEAVVELAARRITNETPALSASTSSLALARAVAERIPGLRTSPHGGVAHACEFETSLYLHLAPELVQEDLIVDEIPTSFPPSIDHDWMGDGPLTFMTWYSQRTRSGVEGAPTHANREKGARLFDECVRLLIELARSFRNLDLPHRVDHRPQPAWREGLSFSPPVNAGEPDSSTASWDSERKEE
jgi:creatinine amidohydrolase